MKETLQKIAAENRHALNKALDYNRQYKVTGVKPIGFENPDILASCRQICGITEAGQCPGSC